MRVAPMTEQSQLGSAADRTMGTVAIVALALAIFVFDAITPVEVSATILYVLVILLAARIYQRAALWCVAAGCIVLSLVAHFAASGDPWTHWAILDRALGLFSIVASTFVVGERQHAEEALRRSEAYLSQAQRLSQTGSFGWQSDEGGQFWSNETFRIYGYDSTSAKPTLDLMLARAHPEDRA